MAADSDSDMLLLSCYIFLCPAIHQDGYLDTMRQTFRDCFTITSDHLT